MSNLPQLDAGAAAYQALLGTLFTWGVTALGASLVFVAAPSRAFLDAALGFAAGVMLAASYWSLLAPALDEAAASRLYGEVGRVGEERT